MSMRYKGSRLWTHSTLYDCLKAEPGAIVALSKIYTAEHPIDILGIADAAGKK